MICFQKYVKIKQLLSYDFLRKTQHTGVNHEVRRFMQSSTSRKIDISQKQGQLPSAHAMDGGTREAAEVPVAF